MTTKEDAYHEGYKACLNEVRCKDNPYIDTALENDWIEGWIQAEKDLLDRPN